MKNKTFQQMLDDGYIFPSAIDQPTQELITEWFQFREVADNKRFIPWFNRSLNLNYPYYRQLMRIDPTVSDFDWLIENYNEHESAFTREDTGSSNRSMNGGDTVTRTETATNSVSNTHTTNDTVTNNGTASTTAKNESTSDNETKGHDEGYTRDTNLLRVAPMSQEYSDTQMKARNDETIKIGETTIKGFAHGHPYLNIDNPTQTQDNLHETGGLTHNTGHTKASGSDTTQTTTSDTNIVTGTATDINNGTNTITGSNTTSKNESANESSRGTSDGVTREISSGRNVNIADLLEKAKFYIIGSRAWDYLYRELNKCFLQTYDYESED